MANIETLLADSRYFADQGSDPSAPASGEPVIYTKSGQLYLRNNSAIVGPMLDETAHDALDHTGLTGVGGGSGGDMVLLDSETVTGSDAATVDLSIATTSRDLLILVSARSDRADTLAELNLRVGTSATVDTGSNYQYHADDSGSSDENTTTGTEFPLGRYCWPAASQTSGLFGGGRVHIPNYAGTVSWKAIEARAGFYAATSREGYLFGSWKNTAAIDVLRFFFSDSANILVGSSFSVYGLG